MKNNKNICVDEHINSDGSSHNVGSGINDLCNNKMGVNTLKNEPAHKPAHDPAHEPDDELDDELDDEPDDELDDELDDDLDELDELDDDLDDQDDELDELDDDQDDQDDELNDVNDQRKSNINVNEKTYVQKIKDLSKKELEIAIENTNNNTQVLKYLKVPNRADLYKILKEKITQYGLTSKNKRTLKSKNPENIMRIRGLTQEELLNVIKNSHSIADMLKYLKIPHKSRAHYNEIKTIIKKYNLSSPEPKDVDLDKIFTKNDMYRSNIKKRFIKLNTTEQKCQICDLGTEYNGKKLVLQLDHINGISNDHNRDNLRLLCPNCHSQTATYAGKRFKKKRICKCGDFSISGTDRCGKCTETSGTSEKVEDCKTHQCDCGKWITKTSVQCVHCLGKKRENLKRR